jgi:hypothetical protein
VRWSELEREEVLSGLRNFHAQDGSSWECAKFICEWGEAVIIGAPELRECVSQDFQGFLREMVALLFRRNGMDHIWLGSHRKEALYTGTMTI